MDQKGKIILKIINTIIIAAIVLMAVLLIGVKLLGMQLFTILSGSMEPDYPTGSLICVREVDPTELKEGDVITFTLSGNTRATHRIVEVLSEDGELRFRTKGDANDRVDANPVSSDHVIGTPIVTIPQLGKLASNLQTPSGRYTAIAIGGGLILFVFVTDFLTSDRKKRKQQDETEQIVKKKA